MRFMQVQGFCVHADRQVAFQRRLIENDERIRGAYLPGAEDGGCYAAVFSSEKPMGDSAWVTILDSDGALDTVAAEGKDPANALAAVLAELGGFFDPNPGGPVQQRPALVQVKLPQYTAGCDADLKKVACDYPPYTLNKIVRAEWNDKGGDAVDFIKKFSWANSDQNEVADYITNGNMTAEEAAKKWIDAHPDTWRAWMPQG